MPKSAEFSEWFNAVDYLPHQNRVQIRNVCKNIYGFGKIIKVNSSTIAIVLKNTTYHCGDLTNWQWRAKLTEFYPVNCKPVHIGWYETIFTSNFYWNGEYWFYSVDSPEKFQFQNISFRGLK